MRVDLRRRFTSGRCCFIPYGHEGLDFVKCGNTLGVRSVLLCIVASVCGLRWLLEQPSESDMEELPEFQFLLSIIEATWIQKAWNPRKNKRCKLCFVYTSSGIQRTNKNQTGSWKTTLKNHTSPGPYEVYCGRFYMGIFGSDTPKRHMLYSNDKAMLTEVLDKAGYMSKKDQQKCTGVTAVKYVDHRGVKRCTGIKKALKESQRLERQSSVCTMWPGLQNNVYRVLCPKHTSWGTQGTRFWDTPISKHIKLSIVIVYIVTPKLVLHHHGLQVYKTL